jgi:hypothetical protein
MSNDDLWKTETVETFEQLVAVVRPLMPSMSTENHLYWFRGQRDGRWQLHSSFMRMLVGSKLPTEDIAMLEEGRALILTPLKKGDPSNHSSGTPTPPPGRGLTHGGRRLIAAYTYQEARQSNLKLELVMRQIAEQRGLLVLISERVATVSRQVDS